MQQVLVNRPWKWTWRRAIAPPLVVLAIVATWSLLCRTAPPPRSDGGAAQLGGTDRQTAQYAPGQPRPATRGVTPPRRLHTTGSPQVASQTHRPELRRHGQSAKAVESLRAMLSPVVHSAPQWTIATRLLDDYCINVAQYEQEVDAPERQGAADAVDDAARTLLQRGVDDSAAGWRQIHEFSRHRGEELSDDELSAENQLFNELVNGLINEAGIPAADVISIVEPGGADNFASLVSRACEDWSIELESPATGD